MMCGCVWTWKGCAEDLIKYHKGSNKQSSNDIHTSSVFDIYFHFLFFLNQYYSSDCVSVVQNLKKKIMVHEKPFCCMQPPCFIWDNFCILVIDSMTDDASWLGSIFFPHTHSTEMEHDFGQTSIWQPRIP